MPDPVAQGGSWITLGALVVFIIASVWLGTLAHRALTESHFLKSYFLGNRGLGTWTLALTATVQSGGTFMGFPSLVYAHGWVIAFWIAGYMVVPITGLGILSKRLSQLSRKTGALTVPDLFRERFGSPAAGLVALLFILFFMTSMMIAQFKAGAIIMKIAWPGSGAFAIVDEATAAAAGKPDTYYYLGLAIFSLTVVGYTLIGGFLAAVWTDLFQSVLMFVGVCLLVPLTLWAVLDKASKEFDPQTLQQQNPIELATRMAVEETGPAYAFAPGYVNPNQPIGAGKRPPPEQFLPLGLSISMFVLWVFSGIGSPSAMVRLMASKSTETIRKSIVVLSVYNLFIYLPLVVICVAGRALMPNLNQPDEIIPRLAVATTHAFTGGSLIAGLILTAPFGAVMATVSSYLVVIASGLVRDVYQRVLNPHASEFQLRWLSYTVMCLVGVIAVVANLNPPKYLQVIVVFSGSGLASVFAVPAVLTCFWRRATSAGVIAAMISGGSVTIGLYLFGMLARVYGYDIGPGTDFRPYYLAGFEPLVWGILSSLIAGVGVSLVTRPPSEEVLAPLFGPRPDAPLAAQAST